MNSPAMAGVERRLWKAAWGEPRTMELTMKLPGGCAGRDFDSSGRLTKLVLRHRGGRHNAGRDRPRN
jgi:hypothetical protein